MIENLDRNVGRMLQKLDQLGLAGNTIVLFTTDNGPNTARYNGGMRGGKGSVFEGGLRVPCFLRWPDKLKAGSRIAIVEATPGSATISFETANGVTGTLTDSGGGQIELKAAGNTITIDSGGVSVQAAAQVSVQASQVEVKAGQVTVNAAVSNFSGIVRCDVLQATTVVASTYTPGAGNIW
jgi:hypothetical protein